jgi:hypothetical protein
MLIVGGILWKVKLLSPAKLWEEENVFGVWKQEAAA